MPNFPVLSTWLLLLTYLVILTERCLRSWKPVPNRATSPPSNTQRKLKLAVGHFLLENHSTLNLRCSFYKRFGLLQYATPGVKEILTSAKCEQMTIQYFINSQSNNNVATGNQPFGLKFALKWSVACVLYVCVTFIQSRCCKSSGTTSTPTNIDQWSVSKVSSLQSEEEHNLRV